MKPNIILAAACVILTGGLAGPAMADTYDEVLHECMVGLSTWIGGASEKDTPQTIFCRAAKSDYGFGKPVEATAGYQKAAEAGYAPAQYAMAMDYEEGVGVEKNVYTALDWYLKAAEQGLADAQNDYAFIYFYGKHGVPADAAKAVPWFRKAADQGYTHSMTLLAEAYFNGTGVTQNYEEAFKWYKAASEKGHPYAMFVYGQMMVFGRGTSKDEAAGIVWLTRSAEAGINEAQLQLAHVYNESESARDPVNAWMWFDLYVRSDNERPKAMGTLEATLTPEQLAQAKTRADAMWVKLRKINKSRSR